MSLYQRKNRLAIGKSSKSDIIFSDFCGTQVCKLCLVKSRPFRPNQNLNQSTYSTKSNKHEVAEKGMICIVCDRKHYIRNMLNASMEAIETNKLAIKNL